MNVPEGEQPQPPQLPPLPAPYAGYIKKYDDLRKLHEGCSNDDKLPEFSAEDLESKRCSELAALFPKRQANTQSFGVLLACTKAAMIREQRLTVDIPNTDISLSPLDVVLIDMLVHEGQCDRVEIAHYMLICEMPFILTSDEMLIAGSGLLRATMDQNPMLAQTNMKDYIFLANLLCACLLAERDFGQASNAISNLITLTNGEAAEFWHQASQYTALTGKSITVGDGQEYNIADCAIRLFQTAEQTKAQTEPLSHCLAVQDVPLGRKFSTVQVIGMVAVGIALQMGLSWYAKRIK